ncbi:MAG: hypothetical protein VB858_10220, partial [Planctomycetaceae bacterium]
MTRHISSRPHGHPSAGDAGCPATQTNGQARTCLHLIGLAAVCLFTTGCDNGPDADSAEHP